MKKTIPPLEIAKPCSMDWRNMTGDERKRFCAGCGKHVFNLSAMTGPEARKFAEETQGRECIAYVPAEDGRIHTPNRFERGLLWLVRRVPRMAAVLALLLPAALAAGVERTTGKPLPPKNPPVRDGGEKEPQQPAKQDSPVVPGSPVVKGKVVLGEPCGPENPPAKPPEKPKGGK
ncbi:hypothetical protein [Luteolibacter sp. LG18]|uniref:hypothetical protein n=1 Tax=Luteolibacter sp. LG18 TaxID=2819286 RepID=UPI002B2F6A73|nr:hypothetical protein llg_03230 [Luteolibacter sp. LG18]